MKKIDTRINIQLNYFVFHTEPTLYFQLGAVGAKLIHFLHSYLMEQFGKYIFKVEYLSSCTEFSVPLFLKKGIKSVHSSQQFIDHLNDSIKILTADIQLMIMSILNLIWCLQLLQCYWVFSNRILKYFCMCGSLSLFQKFNLITLPAPLKLQSVFFIYLNFIIKMTSVLLLQNTIEFLVHQILHKLIKLSAYHPINVKLLYCLIFHMYFNS